MLQTCDMVKKPRKWYENVKFETGTEKKKNATS